ncbi:hypothetical protein [Streptomyces brasiliensis]|uniref:Uncharacterized protein n=1 Tax=Streptomyces brasiliensis TaxID=1954 RepID=A0A917P0X2_9ACTN|nr:hypothetical protein [Streptomyces brasiliensis]GGJ50195.1 hypothetical protein GCM10010121_071580 [Streptomyces brasiliensis]
MTVLTPPVPEATADLARAALDAYCAGHATRPAALEELRSSYDPPAGPLLAWAHEIATPAGFPLLGTSLSAPVYPALVWNGARLDALRPAPDWAPLLAALASADADTGLDRVGAALAAADVVRRQAAALLASDTLPAAVPTLSTLAAATAAALAGPEQGEGLERILDLAAGLTVLTPGPFTAPVAGLCTGHGAASGWLAATLPAEAATPMPGSVAHTLSVAAGYAVPGEGAPASVAALLASLR